jgi:hypothetical protein
VKIRVEVFALSLDHRYSLSIEDCLQLAIDMPDAINPRLLGKLIRDIAQGSL